MDNVLYKVSSTVTNKPVIVSVEIKPQSKFQSFMQRIGLLPKVRVFPITQLTYGTLNRISGLLAGMSGELDDLVRDSYKKLDAHGAHLCRIIAVVLHNKKSEVPESLYEFVEHNLTTAEMTDVLAVALKQMNVAGFINTIILVNGLNVLEMSRNQQGSSIAPGIQSEAS